MASPDVKEIKDAAILLANDLRTGITVYFTEAGSWTEKHDKAWLLTTDAMAEKAMQQATKSESNNEVVGAYLVDATSTGFPTHVRERIRVEGPSIEYLKNTA